MFLKVFLFLAVVLVGDAIRLSGVATGEVSSLAHSAKTFPSSQLESSAKFERLSNTSTFLNLAESAVAHYPPEQCNEASLHEATPRCKELCSASADFHVKLQAPKQYACASFWYDNFGSDQACEQSLVQAHSKMMEALCGEGGICLEDEDEEPKSSKTRGIVFTSKKSNWGLVRKTLVLLPKLKKDRPLPSMTPTSLPAEILVDSADLLADCEAFFEGLAKCIAPKRAPESLIKLGAKGEYGYKVMALLENSFDEVLFLDDDVVPVHDPTLLFESCEFKRTGALFMPDLFGAACQDSKSGNDLSLMGQSGWPEHAMWALTGAKWEPKWTHAQEFESGAVLVDKTRHLKALKLALHFTESPEVQRMLYGDKDAFKFAFLALGASYALSSDRPTQLLMQSKETNGEYNRIGELQRMMGVYMFTHHLPRLLDGTILQFGQTMLNPNQAVALAVPQDSRGKSGYSYCPKVYSGYSAELLQSQQYMLACFPKEGAPCPEQEFGKPTGLLQDAVEALQYLGKQGF